MAQHLNILGKLHAEQLSNRGGAELAARYGALSADHLEYLEETGVPAMASASMVAVLLPGAFYTVRETQVPPIDLFWIIMFQWLWQAKQTLGLLQ